MNVQKLMEAGWNKDEEETTWMASMKELRCEQGKHKGGRMCRAHFKAEVTRICCLGWYSIVVVTKCIKITD